MGEEWTDWFEHDGKGCPCKGLLIEVVAASGLTEVGVCMASNSLAPGYCNNWIWDSLPIWEWRYRVIRYRIRKPRALLDLIHLVENLPETEDA